MAIKRTLMILTLIALSLLLVFKFTIFSNEGTMVTNGRSIQEI